MRVVTVCCRRALPPVSGRASLSVSSPTLTSVQRPRKTNTSTGPRRFSEMRGGGRCDRRFLGWRCSRPEKAPLRSRAERYAIPKTHSSPIHTDQNVHGVHITVVLYTFLQPYGCSHWVSFFLYFIRNLIQAITVGCCNAKWHTSHHEARSSVLSTSSPFLGLSARLGHYTRRLIRVMLGHFISPPILCKCAASWRSYELDIEGRTFHHSVSHVGISSVQDANASAIGMQ